MDILEHLKSRILHINYFLSNYQQQPGANLMQIYFVQSNRTVTNWQRHALVLTIIVELLSRHICYLYY